MSINQTGYCMDHKTKLLNLRQNFLAVDCAEVKVWLLSFVDRFVLNCSVIAALAT